MSITTTYAYSSGSGFVYDPTKITFIGGMAELLLNNNPGQTFSPVIANATYNSSLLAYIGGLLQQIDQRPSTATYYAAWTSQINANWSGSGNGSLVVTANGTAAIDSGGLDLTGYGSGTYATLVALNNIDTTGTGTIEFQYTPNYSGNPSNTQNILSACAGQSSVTNLINIFHTNTGNLSVQVHNSGGAASVNIAAAWSPVSGTTYTITLQYTSGATTLYLNGVSFVTSAATYTRTGVGYVAIGEQYSGSGTPPNFWIKNFAWYSTVVTPSSPVLSPVIYPAATAVMPLFTYAGVASLQAFTAFMTTDTGGAQYTMNGLYWNGTAWVTSNGTYAQSNTASLINSNIATLPASNTLQIDVIYNGGSTQQSVSLITTTYTGQIYPTSAPAIAPNNPLTMDQLYSFADVNTEPDSDTVTYIMRIGTTTKYWYNGTAWVVSNGTVSQSNPASVVQANASTLPISTGQFVTPIALLYTPDGLTTPTLTSLTLVYDYFGERPAGPDVCTVYGYIVDETDTPVSGAIVSITNPTTLINQGIVIAQGILSATTSSIGYFHITLCETASIEASLLFTVQYPQNVSDNLGTPPNNFTFGYAQIPDMPEANFATFTFTPTP